MNLKKSVTMSAPAKINLYLDVLRKRSDGYHDIETVMQAVDICDNVTVSIDTDVVSDEINISCSNPDVPTDETNSCFKAVKEFYEYYGDKSFKTDVYIEKNIPLGGGLGGESADAAAVIAALNNLLDVWLDSEELVNIAARTGADVPFCLIGRTQFCTGIGDDLRQLKSLPDCYIVVAKGIGSVSTKEAYEKVDECESFGDEYIAEKFNDGNINDIAENCRNIFEDALKIPDVIEIENIMQESGALCSSMTGSGSAVFGIFEESSAAQTCCDKIASFGYYAKAVIPLNRGVAILRNR